MSQCKLERVYKYVSRLHGFVCTARDATEAEYVTIPAAKKNYQFHWTELSDRSRRGTKHL
jgi:hypothetical protein